MSVESSPHPPSVERVLVAARSTLGERDHDALVAAARDVVGEERQRLASGSRPATVEALADELVARLDAQSTPGLTPVVNATGVIVHTNLGRAPWPEAAIRAAAAAARGTSLLEMDRDSGQRGSRFRAAEVHLIALTGAEDALVTNNNAAAVALALAAAVAAAPSSSRARGVAVARGELVEIGGGVRIPEIIRRAGLRLVEVGTTNRTRVSDYREALESGTARAVLRVHPSNFTMQGFVEEADPPSSRRWPMGSGPSSSTTSVRAPSSLRKPSAWPTSRRRWSAWPRARTSSASAATSWSAAPSRGWWSVDRSSWRACARTRWPAPCDPTR